MLRTTANEFAQEDYFAVQFFDGHIVIANSLKGLLHLVKFMIVGSKQRLGVSAVLMDIFHDCPSDGYTVVGAGSSSEFVEEDETAFGEVIEDGSGFIHLHHKSRFAQRDVIACSDAGEDLIHHTDRRTLCGYERTHLGEQYDQCRLAKQGGFTGHVRSGNDDNLLTVVIQ